MGGDRGEPLIPAPEADDADALVGVLAVQGDVQEHLDALERLGLRGRRVRRPADLVGLDALTMPGGESSAMLMALDDQCLTEPLIEFLRSDRPILATCAGLILCARKVEQPEQRSFGLLDLTVARNGYGRQIRSGTFALATNRAAGLPDPIPGVFIRAPRITAIGPAVEVLATRAQDPVLVRQGPILGACFHPELQEKHPVLGLFAGMVRTHVRGRAQKPLRLAR